jgi:hypothetical protein
MRLVILLGLKGYAFRDEFVPSRLDPVLLEGVVCLVLLYEAICASIRLCQGRRIDEPPVQEKEAEAEELDYRQDDSDPSPTSRSVSHRLPQNDLPATL